MVCTKNTMIFARAFLAVVPIIPFLSCSNSQPYHLQVDHRYSISESPDTDAPLVITGLTENGQDFRVSIDSLEASNLPVYSFVSIDPWRNVETESTGVLFYHLLNSIGMDENASRVRLIAENDYEVIIPIEHLKDYFYQLTFKEDGEYFENLPKEQKKGVFTISIDFETFDNLNITRYKMDEVWFLRRVEIQ